VLHDEYNIEQLVVQSKLLLNTQLKITFLHFAR